MKNGKYTLEDIDDRIIRYFDAYIKQMLKYTKIDFIKQHSKNREYDDLLKEKNSGMKRKINQIMTGIHSLK